MGDGIFPLVDRETPILDRVRNGKGGQSVTDKVAKEIVAIRDSDDEEAVELMTTFEEQFRDSLSEEMDIPPENISDELVEQFMGLMFYEGMLTNGKEESEEEEDSDEESNPLKDITPDQE